MGIENKTKLVQEKMFVQDKSGYFENTFHEYATI